MYLSRRKFLQLTAASILVPAEVLAVPQVNEKLIHIGQYAAVAFNYDIAFADPHFKIAPDLGNADLLRKAGAYHDRENNLVWIKVAVGSSEKSIDKIQVRGTRTAVDLASIVIFCSSGKIMSDVPGKNRNNVKVNVPDVLHLASFKTVQFNWNDNITKII
jgi:hypothetical protein